MGVQADFSPMQAIAIDLTTASGDAVRKANLALQKTARDIEADAKTLAPVDTGNLRSSIGVDFGDLSAIIGPGANYGIYVEFGTSRMGPQPYLFPALERRAPGFMKAMEQIGVNIL